MSKCVICAEVKCSYNEKGECSRKITFIGPGAYCSFMYQAVPNFGLVQNPKWNDKSVERLDKEEIEVIDIEGK